MSAASLRALKNQIDRGSANLDTIDTWERKKVVTAAEAEEARAYWHQVWDPKPEPEPASGATSGAGAGAGASAGAGGVEGESTAAAS